MTLTTLRLLPDLEAAITRLPGVQAARVVTSGDAKPLEIHVLAEGGKHPKQVVRDIQSMAIAAFDLEVDHRIVSVVQMEGDAGALTRPRPVLASLTIRTVGAERTVTVTLGVQSELYDGVASGPATASALPRQVALATLRSLGVAAGLESCDVEQAEIVEVSGRALAVVVVAALVDGDEKTYAGSAIVGRDQPDAIARAVLDALNRRLTRG